MQSSSQDPASNGQQLPGAHEMAGQAAQALQSMQSGMTGLPQNAPQPTSQSPPQMMPGQIPAPYQYMPPVMMVPPMQNMQNMQSMQYMPSMPSPMPMMYQMVPQQIQSPGPNHFGSSPQPPISQMQSNEHTPGTPNVIPNLTPYQPGPPQSSTQSSPQPNVNQMPLPVSQPPQPQPQTQEAPRPVQPVSETVPPSIQPNQPSQPNQPNQPSQPSQPNQPSQPKFASPGSSQSPVATLQPLLPKPASGAGVDEKLARKYRKKARLLERELHAKMAECIDHHEEHIKLSEVLTRITAENQTLLSLIDKDHEKLPQLPPPAPTTTLSEADAEQFKMVAAGLYAE